ncbi:L-rhamnose/proton symporter RhaT [Planctomycetota bacterium]
MNDLFLGFVLVFIGSVLQGSWAVPQAYVKKWAWESLWIVYSVLAMIVLNLIIAMIFVPNLFEIYQAASGSVFKIMGFGLVWGSGVVLFGLGLAAVGIALSYALMFGALLAVGAIVPMIILHPNDILTTKGLVVILGVLISLVGIAFSGIAGMKKEKDQSAGSEAAEGGSKISMKMGILICVLAGAMISVVNIAFATSGDLIGVAVDLGSSAKYTGNLVWGILFVTGGGVNALYCIYLMGKNKTAGSYRAAGSGKNWLLLICSAIIWIVSFNFFGQGATLMGNWGPIIGWSMFNIIPIATATVWGLFLGEWKGASKGTMKTMATALGFFLIAILVFTYSATI